MLSPFFVDFSPFRFNGSHVIIYIMKQRFFIFMACVLLCLAAACASPAPVAVAITPVPTAAPAASPSPAPTPKPTPMPTPDPDPLTAAPGVYTIAWLSDTQYYSQKWPDTFYTMTAFLRDAAERLDLRYFVHTGDLVNSAGKAEQWEVAVRAMASLSRLPGGVLAGNHDVYHDDVDYSAFCSYFGQKEAALRPCYGGSYADNRGHYDLWEAGATRYVFVYMGYGPDSAAIDWVRSVFDRFPDRVGVLCLHQYFTTGLSLSDDGERFYGEVVSQCPNLYMVLCGHRYNVACVPAQFDDNGDGTPERTVYQMMGNYQAAGSEGGSGYMRFLQIDEAAGEMRVYSYSPLKDDYRYFDEPGTQAEKYAVDPAQEFVQLPLPWLE